MVQIQQGVPLGDSLPEHKPESLTGRQKLTPDYAPIAQGLERCSYKADVVGSTPTRRTILPPTPKSIQMSYHDYGRYTTKWSKSEKDEEAPNPKFQIISPQKKLHDIQQIINSLPDKHMNTYELQEAIQKILDGE